MNIKTRSIRELLFKINNFYYWFYLKIKHLLPKRHPENSHYYNLFPQMLFICQHWDIKVSFTHELFMISHIWKFKWIFWGYFHSSFWINENFSLCIWNSIVKEKFSNILTRHLGHRFYLFFFFCERNIL